VEREIVWILGFNSSRDRSASSPKKSQKRIGKTEVFLHFPCATVQVLDYQWSG
jgi:hypothetical protein